LNSAPAQDLVGSLLFPDAKRPITKKLLTRTDIGAVLALVADERIVASAAETSAATATELWEALSRLRERWTRTTPAPSAI
jgi:hypothetical protein